MKQLFKTSRLRVREAKETDIDFIMSQESHIDNCSFVFQESYEIHVKQMESKQLGLWMIEKIKNEEPVGFMLVNIDKDSEVMELRRIAISEKRDGFGEEIIKGLMGYAFDAIGMNRFWLDVFTDNIRGIALYKKLGMVYEGTLRESHKDQNGYRSQMVFSLLKREYLLEKRG